MVPTGLEVTKTIKFSIQPFKRWDLEDTDQDFEVSVAQPITQQNCKQEVALAEQVRAAKGEPCQLTPECQRMPYYDSA